MRGLIHPELSYAVVGAAMDVHNEMGPGLDEEVYHLAMLRALSDRGLRADSKVRGNLMHRGVIAHEFVLDILVENTVIVELKQLVGSFAPIHYLQLLNYLKFWNKDLGLLLNYGLERLQSVRVPYTPSVGEVTRVGLGTSAGAELAEDLVAGICREHGLGYDHRVYKSLFMAECDVRGFSCVPPMVNLCYKGCSTGSRLLDVFCLNNDTLLLISALEKQTSGADYARMTGYLRHTGLQTGVIANFGRACLEVSHVSR